MEKGALCLAVDNAEDAATRDDLTSKLTGVTPNPLGDLVALTRVACSLVAMASIPFVIQLEAGEKTCLCEHTLQER